MKKQPFFWRIMTMGLVCFMITAGGFFARTAWSQENPNKVREGGIAPGAPVQQRPAGGYFKSRLQEKEVTSQGQTLRPESPMEQKGRFARPVPAWDPGDRPEGPTQSVSGDTQQTRGAGSPMRPEAPIQAGRPEMPMGTMRPETGAGMIEMGPQRPAMPLDTMRPEAPVHDLQRPEMPMQGMQRPAAPTHQMRPAMPAPMKK